MGIYGYGIKYGNKIKKLFASLKPCLDNALIYSGVILYDSNTVENKIEGEADIAISNSNTKQFDGINDYVVVQDNIIPYLDDLEISNSEDGVTFNDYKIGDPNIAGLYMITDNKLYIGWDGKQYFTGYISINTYTNISDNNIDAKYLEFTFAEGIVNESIDRVDKTITETEPSQIGLLFHSLNTINNTIVSDTIESEGSEPYLEGLLFKSNSTINNKVYSDGIGDDIIELTESTVLTETSYLL